MKIKRIIITLAIVAAFTASAFIAGAVAFRAIPQSDESLARAVVDTCAHGAKQNDPCYEQTIPALMDSGISMQRAFAITRVVQELDPTYRYCHVLAHLISVKETAKDPSKWKDVIAQSPSGMCGNGALHGAFQERFRSESMPNASVSEIAGLIDGACDPRAGWEPTFLERSSCMHGMGHLLLFITDAHVEDSLRLCKILGKEPGHDFVETCEEGIFMQIYQPLEPEEVALVAKISPAASDPLSFCAKFPGLSNATCIKESWPTKRDIVTTPEGFESVCAPLIGTAGYDNCARGLVYVVMGMKEYDAQTMLSLCSKLSTKNLRDICVSRTADRYIETDWRNIPEALSVCTDSPDSADACWSGLSNFAELGMRQNSPQTKALCGGMPEPWRGACLNRTHTKL